MKQFKMTIPKGEDFVKQNVTPGLVNAKCYSIVDLGTQDIEWQGQIKKQRKFQITFETKQMGIFKDKTTGEDVKKPLVIGKKYTLSLGDSSALKKDLKSWLGKEPEGGFNIFSLVGKPALIQAISAIGKKDSKEYININTILPSDDDFKLVNDIQLFSLEKGLYSEDDFKKLPERMQKTIVLSDEYQKMCLEEQEEKIPF